MKQIHFLEFSHAYMGIKRRGFDNAKQVGPWLLRGIISFICISVQNFNRLCVKLVGKKHKTIFFIISSTLNRHGKLKLFLAGDKNSFI